MVSGLSRALQEARHQGRRLGWVILCAWALAATAVWDMFLVAAIDLHAGGLGVRYDIISIVASIVASVAALAALLWLVTLRATTVRILVGGALVGAVVATDSYQALTAIQVNAIVTFRTATIVVGGVLVAIATTSALLLPIRSTRRGVPTGMAVFFAAVLTAAHYMSLHAISISQSVARTAITGILPTAVIVPVAIIFVLRLLMLLTVLLANDAATKASITEVGGRRSASVRSVQAGR